jgi:DNA polymerase-3 subunit delta'
VKLTFSRTADQQTQKEFLSQAVAGNTFPQALLLHGPKGVGQSSLLVDLAEILLCCSSENRPCGTCPRCKEWKNRNRDNLYYLFPHPDSQHKNRDTRIQADIVKWETLLEDPYALMCGSREHISIDQIRELTEKLSYAEIAERNRVVLIFWAESMFEPAANALLKILEETPPRTYFILSCERRANILPTILSRCVMLDLPSLSLSAMKQFLSAKAPETDSSQNLELMYLSHGSPGTYLQLEMKDGPALLNLAKAFMENSVQKQWYVFSEFIEKNPDLEDPEKCLQVLNFVLELMRFSVYSDDGMINSQDAEIIKNHSFHTLEALKILKGSYRKLDDYRKFVENCIQAISHYAKPSIALLGNFMDLE